MMRTLYYALGGGYGHVTRARRVLQALCLAEEATIIAGSAALAELRNARGIPTIAVPPELERSVDQHRRWLEMLVREQQVERLLVDTFPAGIHGELSGLATPGLRVDYVGRLLRWDAYAHAVPAAPPRFHSAFAVEELTAPHAAFLKANSDAMQPLDLAPIAAIDSLDQGIGVPEPYSLVVHSGPAAEVLELIDHCRTVRALDGTDERIVVVTGASIVLPDDVERLDRFPASPLFSAATRIVSAAGFNVILESEPWRHKHHVVPFDRRFDDQYLRAARRRSRMSGAQIATLPR
jgi:UDP:flavonoid glycosyltransferase YjiC (YdhE family)